MSDNEIQQEQRTFLRERFLRLLGSLSGLPVQVHMHEKTDVKCNFAAADIEFQHVHVTNLHTPMGLIPNATLRTSDIYSMEFKDVNAEKERI